jgi:hypothetical protein
MANKYSRSIKTRRERAPTTAKRIDIPWVAERDIDLLLLEEISSSPNFLKWFLAQTGISGRASLVSAGCAVHTTKGESDLEVTVQYAGRIYRILVEDKIGAAFQPRQSERYRERKSLHRGTEVFCGKDRIGCSF